ncbi:hypothetical protein [Streptomyces sp. A1547]|uniref:hypothetical protein n=1 Tax=Streptomyces sp. A1547 TaxID=2563105 RepID=UPI001F0E56B1|nr:hypothetical protein [Streptomyces sp. A1547]
MLVEEICESTQFGLGAVRSDEQGRAEAEGRGYRSAMIPATAVRKGIEESLRAQVADAVVEWIKILETPRFLTGGRQHAEDERAVLLTRAALAAPFALSVRTTQHGRSILLGVFSWAAVNLAPPKVRKDRHWFDLGVGLDWAGERLHGRIYEMDGEDSRGGGPRSGAGRCQPSSPSSWWALNWIMLLPSGTLGISPPPGKLEASRLQPDFR